MLGKRSSKANTHVVSIPTTFTCHGDTDVQADVFIVKCQSGHSSSAEPSFLVGLRLRQTFELKTERTTTGVGGEWEVSVLRSRAQPCQLSQAISEQSETASRKSMRLRIGGAPAKDTYPETG